MSAVLPQQPGAVPAFGRAPVPPCGWATPAMRPETAFDLPPLDDTPADRDLPLAQRLWHRAAVRKTAILMRLALLWEVLAR